MSVTYRKSRWSKAEREQALQDLRELLKPGDTVYTVLRHVSSSGMVRDISPIALDTSSRVPDLHIAWKVAAAIGRTYVESNGSSAVRCNGVGMDMGFDLVYSLGWHLWPNGTPEPHGTRNGEPDSAGGYALKQRWL